MSFTPLSQRRKTGPSRHTYVWIAIILIIGFFVVRHINYTKAINNGLDPEDNKTRILLIQKGDSAVTVGKRLEEKGIISKASYFSDYLDDQDLENKILAGRFEVSPAMPITHIASIVTDAKQAKNYITIPEGFTVKKIDERLSDQEIIKSGDFIAAVKKFDRWQNFSFLPKQDMIGSMIPLEGFLFPDTYKIDAGNFSADDLIDQMLTNFQKKITNDITNQLSTKNISLYELITVASMLEREVRHADDLAIVSGIIWKRANSGWFLNIDATLLYDLNRQNLTKSDLQQDSPYNTYTRKGLPPGPIGNPGIKTILAALHPEKTSHWFYITDPKTGKAIFADTNDQQNRNRAIYLK